MNYKIRTVTINDAQKIYDMGKECFDWYFERMEWSASTVSYCIDCHYDSSFVAAKNEEVIGFILTFIRDDIGYIGWVAVTEKYRRKGIGTELVKRAVTSLKEKGIRTVASHVRFDDSSLAIFEKNGFKRSNEIKIEMIKEI